MCIRNKKSEVHPTYYIILFLFYKYDIKGALISQND